MDRRRFLASLSAGAISFAGCTGARPSSDSTTTPKTDEPLDPIEKAWSTYRYDAARTGFNPASGTSPGERSGHWTSHLMGQEGYERFAVVDGTVYIGDTGGAVHAVEATTGEELWSMQLLDQSDNEARWLTMTVAEDALYAGNHLGVHALDIRSQERQWTVEYDQEAYGGETVLVGDVLVAESSSTTVAGIDTASGDGIWEFETGDDGIVTNLATDGSLVFFMTSGLTVFALDIGTGEVAWETVAEDVYRSFDLAVTDGRLIITSGAVVALDANTGEHLWTVGTRGLADYSTEQSSLLPIGRAAASGGPQASAPALAHGLVYLKTGRHQAAIALDAGTGELAWSVETDEAYDSPIVAGETTYVATGSTIHAYDASDGEPTGWKFEAIGPVSAFVVVDGVVFASGGRGFLQALTAHQA